MGARNYLENILKVLPENVKFCCSSDKYANCVVHRIALNQKGDSVIDLATATLSYDT